MWCPVLSVERFFFRFLALGADPNYADPEKGNTPLHVAAKENQQLQVELLWVYGADAAQRNAAGHTPAAAARLEKHVRVPWWK